MLWAAKNRPLKQYTEALPVYHLWHEERRTDPTCLDPERFLSKTGGNELQSAIVALTSKHNAQRWVPWTGCSIAGLGEAQYWKVSDPELPVFLNEALDAERVASQGQQSAMYARFVATLK